MAVAYVDAWHSSSLKMTLLLMRTETLSFKRRKLPTHLRRYIMIGRPCITKSLLAELLTCSLQCYSTLLVQAHSPGSLQPRHYLFMPCQAFQAANDKPLTFIPQQAFSALPAHLCVGFLHQLDTPCHARLLNLWTKSTRAS